MRHSLPAAITITDNTLRDGFQNISEWIPTPVKLAVLDALAAAGVSRLEASSFVSPRAIPQMADAAEIVRHLKKTYPAVEAVALVPNLHGAANAVAAGVDEVSYVISASSAHNLANIQRSHQQSLDDLAAIRGAFPGLRVNLSMSTAFGCPFSGETPVSQVVWLLGEAVARGVHSATLCDTIGVATPLHVEVLLESVRQRFAALPLALHFHDTHGMGIANTVAAMQAGVTRFESAAGGLGGCPFAPGAAGNTSTEDMVNMVHRMGIHTGVDLEKYLAVVGLIKERIQPLLPGRLASVRSYAEFCFFPLPPQ